MKNRFAMASIAAVLVGLTACSDSPVSPAAKSRPPVMTGPGFALIQQPSSGTPSTMTVCSANASATFTVSAFAGGGAPQVPPLADAPAPYTLALNAGQCATIWVKGAPESLPADPITTVSITQTGQQAGYAFSLVEAAGNTGTAVNQGTKTATLGANAFHGATATFTQVLVPSTGCTYTKGWYQNKNGAPTIVVTYDGRTPDQQRAIFAATPGKPGNVTWDGDNNTLNLYQQLLAALNNVGNKVAPVSVTNAINAALAATGGSGLNITLVGNPDVGALIGPLSSFNEGSVGGWPHCD